MTRMEMDWAMMPDNQIVLPPVRSGTVIVAVVQAAPVLFDTPKTLRKLADLAADAARKGAELVVFPEAFVGGYPKGHDFGVSLGVRTPEGRDQFRSYFESAVEVPGPVTETIGSVARGHGIHIVVGLIERAGGTLYCTAAMFGPGGGLLGTHRKLVPTALERVVWGQGDGSTLPVVVTPLGRVGAVICWENYMPLLRTTMYAKGVELYCAVTVDDRETWVPTVRHIAIEGRCFVMSACQFLRRADLPPGYPTDRFPAAQDVLIRGGSCVVGPLGELLAGPVYGQECVLTATLDRADLARAKFDLDVVGHYARPDVFRLTVNEAAARPVAFTPAPAAPGHGSVTPPLTLLEVEGRFAVCKLPPGSAVPAWATAGDVFSVTRTGDELSVVCRQEAVAAGTQAEVGWRCLRVAGAMPFTLVGVLASLTAPIAKAGVGVFAVSTFDTDYLLVKEAELPTAVDALRAAGHLVERTDP
jgi:nitrilase